jgi:hypothetical protein
MGCSAGNRRQEQIVRIANKLEAEALNCVEGFGREQNVGHKRFRQVVLRHQAAYAATTAATAAGSPATVLAAAAVGRGKGGGGLADDGIAIFTPWSLHFKIRLLI